MAQLNAGDFGGNAQEKYGPPEDDVIGFCQRHRLPFAEGNVIKYVVRHRVKDGREDLLKAIDYLNRIIAECYPTT